MTRSRSNQNPIPSNEIGHSMASWQLAVLIFCAWFLCAVAALMQVAVEDSRHPLPSGRRGVSIIPYFIPPAVFWGIAKLIDRGAAPWGTTVVGYLHAAFAVILLVSIARDWRRLRALAPSEPGQPNDRDNGSQSDSG